MPDQRRSKRFRRRMACEIDIEGRPQRAIVLDVSRTGLFVQITARLLPGTMVELRLRVAETSEPIALRARVARHKSVPANLTSVAQGGVGLRIVDAPAAFYEVLGVSGDTPTAGSPAAFTTAPPDAPAVPPSPRFRVRVKQTDGPRSRILDIAAATAESARTAALAEVGRGWEALGAEPL